MEQDIIYVGLDVHKDTIAVALAEAGKRAEVREYGKIANTPAALKTLCGKAGAERRQATILLRGRPLRLWHPAPVERSRTRMRRGGAVADSSQTRRSDQDRSAGRASTSPSCTGRANSLRSGFLTQPMRLSAIWCARDWLRCACCGRRASNCPASCCAMAIIITGRPGP